MLFTNVESFTALGIDESLIVPREARLRLIRSTHDIHTHTIQNTISIILHSIVSSGGWKWAEEAAATTRLGGVQ